MAAAELAAVRSEFATRPPAERIFAYEDPERPTPWPVPPGATSLADCFVTTSRSNLLDVIDEAIRDAEEAGADVEIRAFPVDDPHVLFATDG